MAKAYSGNTQYFIAKKVVEAPTIPAKYGIADSVSGLVHPFFKVGIEANPSLIIAKIIAKFASFVIAHNIKARAEKNPQR